MAELTLEDIAKKVGVSRATVSRVVNGFPSVNPDVRSKVLEVIQETGYHPNAAARSLASQRSGVVGLMLPRSVSSFFTDPFFPLLTQGVAYGCNKNDLTLSLYLVSNKEDEEKIYPRISRRGLLDGILVQSGQPDDRMIEYLATSRVPNVILGRPFIPDGANYIDVDNVIAGANATRHLIKLGYKRIATITGERNSAATIDRLEGYKQALKTAGREIDESLITEGEFTESGGYTAMQQLIPFRPDAVFAASDSMAVGAMSACLDAGLKIPEDVAFVGFDDVPIANLTKVKLTTIRQPIMQFGIKAVELLIDVITNGKKPARRITLETELVIRESCGAQKLGAR
jgi:LacI family transcriptional regulator